MENSNEYFVSINEVSKRLNVPAHTLRYWEKQFPSAIRPTTGAGGRRYYRAETVEKLVVIKDLLYRHKMTIAGVKKLLHDGAFPSSASELATASHPCVSASTLSDSDLELVIKLLETAQGILQ